MTDNNELAELLFGDIKETPDCYEKKYPPRGLPEGTPVTRIGPSPTGFVHLGNLYNALIGERLAHQNGGVFFLRIEDTDAKREVEGAVGLVISAMDFFGIRFDEGASESGDRGEYGPYRQRLRKEIYQCYAKELVRRGLAYPCFCTEDELAKMREEQTAQKLNPGYYGKWAVGRSLSLDEIKQKLANGEEYVLRFRSSGSEGNHVEVYDAIRGTLRVSENYQDFVLLKSDGIPTYHFAHVIDDHLMRTTHVVRGEEWLSTLPIHVQLFDALGFERPIYCHTAVLMKMDGETKRKLSKRKDPELGLDFYKAQGYSPAAVKEYLMTVLNSNFEEWRAENPDAALDDFPFSLEKMSSSGALFDVMKFEDVSREVLLRTPADKIYDEFSEWLREYDPEFYPIFTRDRAYSESVLDVGRHAARPRKDLTGWKQAREFISFYYKETFKMTDDFPERVSPDDRKLILQKYLDTFDMSDDSSAWFGKVREITAELGYAVKPKDFKKNPDMYKGSVSDVSAVLRVGLTGRTNSPDLWEIIHIIGEDEMRRRIENIIE